MTQQIVASCTTVESKESPSTADAVETAVSQEEVIIQAMGNAFMAGLRAALENSALFGLKKVSVPVNIDLNSAVLILNDKRVNLTAKGDELAKVKQVSQLPQADSKPKLVAKSNAKVNDTASIPTPAAAAPQSSKEKRSPVHTEPAENFTGLSLPAAPPSITQSAPFDTAHNEPLTTESSVPSPVPAKSKKAPSPVERAPFTDTTPSLITVPQDNRAVSTKKSATKKASPSASVTGSVEGTSVERATSVKKPAAKSSVDTVPVSGPIEPALVSIPPPSRAESVTKSAASLRAHLAAAKIAKEAEAESSVPLKEKKSSSPAGGSAIGINEPALISVPPPPNRAASVPKESKRRSENITIDQLPSIDKCTNYVESLKVSSVDELQFLICLSMFSFCINEAKTMSERGQLQMHEPVRALILDDSFTNSVKQFLGVNPEVVYDIFNNKTLYNGRTPVPSKDLTTAFTKNEMYKYFRNPFAAKVLKTPSITSLLGVDNSQVIVRFHELVQAASAFMPAMVFFPNEFMRLILASSEPFVEKYLP